MVLNISLKGLKFLPDVSKNSVVHFVNLFNPHETANYMNKCISKRVLL